MWGLVTAYGISVGGGSYIGRAGTAVALYCALAFVALAVAPGAPCLGVGLRPLRHDGTVPGGGILQRQFRLYGAGHRFRAVAAVGVLAKLAQNRRRPAAGVRQNTSAGFSLAHRLVTPRSNSRCRQLGQKRKSIRSGNSLCQKIYKKTQRLREVLGLGVMEEITGWSREPIFEPSHQTPITDQCFSMRFRDLGAVKFCFLGAAATGQTSNLSAERWRQQAPQTQSAW